MFETLGKLQETLNECHEKENDVKQDMQKQLDVVQHEMNEKIEQIKQAYQPQMDEIAQVYTPYLEKCEQERTQLYTQKNEIAKTFFEEIMPKQLSIMNFGHLDRDRFELWLASDKWKVIIELGEPDPWDEEFEGQLLLSYKLYQMQGKEFSDETERLMKEIEQMIVLVKEKLENLPKYRLLTVYQTNVVKTEQTDVRAIDLTKIEQKVWELYRQRKTYDEIGKVIGKTKKAVDNTVQRIRGKMIW